VIEHNIIRAFTKLRVDGTNGMHENLFRSTYSICTVSTLILNRWIPPSIKMNYMIRRHNVETDTSASWGKNQNSKSTQGRKPVTISCR
jgi:hypothetical protein